MQTLQAPPFLGIKPFLWDDKGKDEARSEDQLRNALLNDPDFSVEDFQKLKALNSSPEKEEAFKTLLKEVGKNGIADEVATQYILRSPNFKPDLFLALMNEGAHIHLGYLNLCLEAPERHPDLKERLLSIFSRPKAGELFSECLQKTYGDFFPTIALDALALLTHADCKEAFQSLFGKEGISSDFTSEILRWFTERSLPQSFSLLVKFLSSHEIPYKLRDPQSIRIRTSSPAQQQILHDCLGLFEKNAIIEKREFLEKLSTSPQVLEYKNEVDRTSALKEGAASKTIGGSGVQEDYRRLMRENVLELVFQLHELSKIPENEKLVVAAWELILDAGFRRKRIGLTLGQAVDDHGKLRNNGRLRNVDCATSTENYLGYPEKMLEVFARQQKVEATYELREKKLLIQPTSYSILEPGVLWWTHHKYELSEYKEILSDLLLKAIMLPKGKDQIRQQLGELHWWFANMMPFIRGSAAAIEMIIDALWIHHGFTPPEPIPGKMLDCEALTTPDMQEFIDQYPVPKAYFYSL